MGFPESSKLMVEDLAYGVLLGASVFFATSSGSRQLPLVYEMKFHFVSPIGKTGPSKIVQNGNSGLTFGTQLSTLVSEGDSHVSEVNPFRSREE